MDLANLTISEVDDKFPKIDWKEEECPECESISCITEAEETSMITYGVGEDKKTIPVTQPMMTCSKCNFKFTDYRGEHARAMAIEYDEMMECMTEIDGRIGDLLTVDEFKGAVECNGFIDYDGHGDMLVDGVFLEESSISPSEAHKIPENVTHILWYNK